jgi:hypothetical protein
MARTPLTRRTFLQAAGAAAASAAVGCGSSDTFSPTPSSAYPVEDLTKDDFVPLVGQMLAISHPTHGTSMITLDGVRQLAAQYPPDPGFRDPFVVGASGGTTPTDDLYTFNHPVRGPLNLFLFSGGGGANSIQLHFN